MKKLKVLELFAGTRSIGKAFEKLGHEVYSIEWDEVHENIDWYTDIGEVTAQDILDRFGQPDVIWASPDCTSYSIAGITHHRRKEEDGNLKAISEYGEFCDKVNAHVVQLIKDLNPIYYFIENPRAGMRKMDFVQDLPRHTTSYCNYNDPLVQKLIFDMTEKKCSCCGIIKNIDCFYADIEKRNGFSSICKACENGQDISDEATSEINVNKDQCAYCKCDLDDSCRHVDYIMSMPNDDKKIESNTQYICTKCKESKGDKTEEEWLKKERMKPTDIWSNHPNHQIAPTCKNGSSCHISAPRGSTTGTQGMKSAILKSVIPAPLCDHIAKVCEEVIYKPWEDMNIAELEHVRDHLANESYNRECDYEFARQEIKELNSMIKKLKNEEM